MTGHFRVEARRLYRNFLTSPHLALQSCPRWIKPTETLSDTSELIDHKRRNIEATNAAIKRKFGETLKSKNPVAQVNELLAKIVAYNLTVVIHEMHENGIVPNFLNQGHFSS